MARPQGGETNPASGPLIDNLQLPAFALQQVSRQGLMPLECRELHPKMLLANYAEMVYQCSFTVQRSSASARLRRTAQVQTSFIHTEHEPQVPTCGSFWFIRH